MSEQTPVTATGRAHFKLYDVEGVFDGLTPRYVENHEFDGGGGGAVGYSHVQGVAQCGNYLVVSRNQKGSSRGLLNIFRLADQKFVRHYEIPVEHMNHPSGMQRIGDYLVVALQSSDYDKNEIRFFNIRSLICDESGDIEMLPLMVDVPGQDASAVGIADVPVDGRSGEWRYVLCVSGSGTTSVYSSNATSVGLEDPDLKFSKSSSSGSIGSYQGIQVLAQSDGSYYVLAFDSEPSFLTFNDFMLLWKAVPSGSGVDFQLYRKTSITTSGGGQLGAHCRYGTAAWVRAEAQLVCLVTNRASPQDLTVNYFNAVG